MTPMITASQSGGYRSNVVRCDQFSRSGSLSTNTATTVTNHARGPTNHGEYHSGWFEWMKADVATGTVASKTMRPAAARMPISNHLPPGCLHDSSRQGTLNTNGAAAARIQIAVVLFSYCTTIVAVPVTPPRVADTVADPTAIEATLPDPNATTTPEGDTDHVARFVMSEVLPSLNVPVA